jgi:hypothetical protein
VQCQPYCQEVFGANTAGAHDAGCPFKLLRCPQGCGVNVPRRHLKAHMAGPCERRPVVCPYHHMVGGLYKLNPVDPSRLVSTLEPEI